MQRTLIRLIATSLATLCTFAALAAPVAVPGTKVTIEPPEGFALSKQFPGFMREDVNASIVVTEMPAPVMEIKKAMNKEDLATKGMVLLESKAIKHAGKDALFVKVSQQASGIDFLKWMLITGEERATTLVVGTFRSDTEDELSAPMRTAVLSTSFGAAPKDAFEGLQFRIEPSAKLKVAARVANMLMLNESGTTTPVAAEAPLYVIGSSVNETTIGDLPKFAQARAAKTAKVKDVRNFKGQPIKLDGLAAYEIVADATDSKTGKALRLYQVIAPEGSNYFIAQGLVGAQRAGEFVPEFQRITGSFKKASQ
jgi:hypothetical protein